MKRSSALRERISINNWWRFIRYNGEPDSLIYDERQRVGARNDNIVADTRATDTSLAFSVRTKKGKPGVLRIKASAPGIKSASLEIRSQ